MTQDPLRHRMEKNNCHLRQKKQVTSPEIYLTTLKLFLFGVVKSSKEKKKKVIIPIRGCMES
jgi:hypothetical protein